MPSSRLNPEATLYTYKHSAPPSCAYSYHSTEFTVNNEDFGCDPPGPSAPLACWTDLTSSYISPQTAQSTQCSAVIYPGGPDRPSLSPSIHTSQQYAPTMYAGQYERFGDDVVGQYLEQQAMMQSMYIPYSIQASYLSGGDRFHRVHSYHERRRYESHAHPVTPYPAAGIHVSPFVAASGPPQLYPDPESIRHLHTLHRLLRHIQPERKLNSLSGLELDIVEGDTGNILYYAVPKQMLVTFLGRHAVSKFLHTVQREDNENWTGLPTQQNLRILYGVTSRAALKILISWMTRACQYATLYTMKNIRIPTNLFVACSLAQTTEILGLHRDAFRVDVSISQEFLKRPMHTIELETLWHCLGEQSKYVYGAIKALSERLKGDDTRINEDLQGLAIKLPRLYARLCDPMLNDEYMPAFGREWFTNVGDRGAGDTVLDGD